MGTVSDCEWSESQRTMDDFIFSAIFDVEGEPCNFSNTEVHRSVETLAGQSPSHSIERPDQQQCRRTGKGWRCHAMASLGKRYCEKHHLEQSTYNEKRRNRRKEQNCLVAIGTEEDDQQCRRTAKAGWRCSQMVLPGKRYCGKHELEQSAYNEMRRKRRREQSRLVAGDHSTGLKRMKEKDKLSQVSNTLVTDIADESSTKKRRTKKLTPKRGTMISSPCKKLQNEEATEGCLSDIIVHTRTVTGSETFDNISPEGEKALQKKKDESQKLSEAYLSPSEEFSDHPTPSFAGEMVISFLDNDMGGTVLKISDSNTASLSKIKGGEQCASLNNSQKNPDLDYTPHWITSLVGDEINQQKQEVGKDATTTLERTVGQSEEMVSGTSVEDPKHKASCEEITDVTQTERISKESEILVKKTCNFIEDVQTSPVLLESSPTRMDIRISPDSLLTSQSNMDITLTEASMKRQVQHSFCVAKCSESFKAHSDIADQCNNSVADEISDRLTVLSESVSEINKKRRMVEMEKKNRGAALQKRLRELEEEILETEREFDRVVAAPW